MLKFAGRAAASYLNTNSLTYEDGRGAPVVRLMIIRFK